MSGSKKTTHRMRLQWDSTPSARGVPRTDFRFVVMACSCKQWRSHHWRPESPLRDACALVAHDQYVVHLDQATGRRKSLVSA